MRNFYPFRFSGIVLLLTVFWVIPVFPQTYVVITTQDTGLGSLRQAILYSQGYAGPDTIVFNIPKTDAGYDSAAGVWTIHLLSYLESLYDDGTVLDGTTQATSQGDTNPYGPEIEIDGTGAGAANGFWLSGSNNVLKGLVINRFQGCGIVIKGS